MPIVKRKFGRPAQWREGSMAKTKLATTAKTTASRKPVAAARTAAPVKAPPAGKAAAKPAKVELVTLRQLASAVGEAHGLSQKQANEVLAGTIALIGEHLKKGARSALPGSEPLRCVSAPPAWDAIPPLAKRSRSRRARKWRSAPRRISARLFRRRLGLDLRERSLRQPYWSRKRRQAWKSCA